MMEHIHDDHTHIHTHCHEDGLVHAHSHTGTEFSGGLEETKALLSYMIHHNEHHAEELAALMDSLPKRAQKKLTTAIGTFEAANVELQQVLDCLD